MVNYSITITNESNVNNRVYLLFQEKPNNDSTTFQTIYTASPPTPSNCGANVVFRIPGDLYAVCGTPPQALGKGVRVATSSYLPVKIATGGGSSTPGSSVYLTTADESPRWQNEKTKDSNNATDAFVINTDNSFQYPNSRHFFIGLGARDPFNNNRITPVAAIEAEPGRSYPIYPKAVYYVCVGSYAQGEIIDYNNIGKKLRLDFGVAGTAPEASFTQGPNGSFSADDPNSSKIGKVVD